MKLVIGGLLVAEREYFVSRMLKSTYSALTPIKKI
jgi:hypothetical protein